MSENTKSRKIAIRESFDVLDHVGSSVMSSVITNCLRELSRKFPNDDEQVLREKLDHCTIDWRQDYGDSVDLYISYTNFREETDEEFNSRTANESKQKENAEKSERAQYLKLKQKYEAKEIS